MNLHILIAIILIAGNIFAEEVKSEYNQFDEIANYLAGYDSPIEHQEEMDKLWDDYEEKNLKYLQEWQISEIASLNLSNDCKVFYPFSGPDVVHMITLFPNCKKYVMVGLEPNGRVANLEKEKIDLEFLRKGIYSLLNRSFFVTSEMWGSFRIEKNGLMVPMLALLKRLDCQIIKVEQFYLNEQGISTTDVKVGNGIKITFKQDDYDYPQEIFYIRKSLTEDAHGIDLFIKNDKPLITYIKAAQYTLFDSRFAIIRKAIVDQSDIVLQDDSGLPYRYFNNKNWQVSFYGNYEGPYGKEFKAYGQEDLKRVYEKSDLKPLPFSLGYGYRKISTILIKAIKKTLSSEKSEQITKD
jgi:hypothetical protein